MSRLVSVLMPAFNCAAYVQEAIQSILEQSYPHFELLICDDGSEDETFARILEIRDQRIVLHRNLQNQGYPAVMNLLFSSAKGPFVMIQDGDDLAHKHRIEKLIRVLDQNPEAGLAGSGLIKFYPDGKRIKICSELSVSMLNNSFTQYCRPEITFGTLLMRRDVTKVPFRDLRFITRAHDMDWLFRVSEQYRFINCPELLYEYRQHDQSMSNANQRENLFNYFFWEYICFITQSRRERAVNLLLPAYEKQLLDFLNTLIEQKKRIDPVFWERHLAYRAKRNGNRTEALSHAFRGLRAHPLHRGSYQCLYKILFLSSEI